MDEEINGEGKKNLLITNRNYNYSTRLPLGQRT